MARRTISPEISTPRPCDLFFGLEPGEEGAVAAAEIEDLGAGLDDLADDGVVAAAEGLAGETLGAQAGGVAHDCCSSAKVLARKPRTSSVCSFTSMRKASWP